MGGEGYALERALSVAALAQLRSKEDRARSAFPRRSPSEIFEVSIEGLEDCMDETVQATELVAVRFLPQRFDFLLYDPNVESNPARPNVHKY